MQSNSQSGNQGSAIALLCVLGQLQVLLWSSESSPTDETRLLDEISSFRSSLSHLESFYKMQMPGPCPVTHF